MSKKPLTFLHLSDIHFRRTRGRAKQLDSFVREELEKEFAEICKSTGKIDAVLVTGDITFSGAKDEYDSATTWLDKICTIGGCPRTDVVVVPGNHDVSRIATKCVHSRALNRLIRKTKTIDEAEELVDEVYETSEAVNILYSGFSNYNDFASQYECNLSPERPVITKKIDSQKGISFVFWGMNSCLVSNDEDKLRNMFIDERQVSLPKDESVFYISLCHHPSSWWRLPEKAQKWLDSKAPVQLYGHIHQSSTAIAKDGRVLKIYAGAVQPQRFAGVWKPAFSVFTIDRSSSNGKQYLEIERHSRIWGDASSFEKSPGQNGKTKYSVLLDLPKKKKAAGLKVVKGLREPKIMDVENKEFLEELSSDDSGRSVLSRDSYQKFMRFSKVVKIEMLLELGIESEEKLKLLTGSHQFAELLSKPIEQSLMEKLKQKISEKAEELGI